MMKTGEVFDSEILQSKAFVGQHIRNYVCPSHIHFAVEAVIVRYGTLKMEVAGRIFTVHAGQAVLICPFEPHGYLSGGENDCYILNFFNRTVTCFSSFLLNHIPIRRIITLEPYFVGFCDSMLAQITDENKDLFLGKAVLYPLCYLFSQKCDFVEQKSDETMIRAITMIYEGGTADISLTELAERLHIRPETLCRQFVKTTGMSYKSFVNTVRIENAIEMIGRGFSMTETAYRAGFSSVRTFNRVFKAVTGVVPSAYDTSFSMPMTRTNIEEDDIGMD